MSIAAPPWRASRAFIKQWQTTWVCAKCWRRSMTTDGRFEAGDTALLRRSDRSDHDGLLLWPLDPAKTVHRDDGMLNHDTVIGKRVREIVATHKGRNYRIHDPTLDEYVRLTPRSCTPIYATDANLIVSLLDIHIARNTDDYAILEAGTGHGSLTLHLARAIHPANASIPSGPARVAPDEEADANEGQDPRPASRRAVIHTVDDNRQRSKHAQKIVRGFKAGLYAHNVDFHVSGIDTFLRRATTGAKTFDHIILDLPGSHGYFPLVAQALKVDGCLLLWVPSVTQILESMKAVRNDKLPLFLDRVIEVGPGLSGGRPWDVRWTRIRDFDRKAGGLTKAGEERRVTNSAVDSAVGDMEARVAEDSVERALEGSRSRDDEAGSPSTHLGSDGEAVVCRPKVGERTVGGGFIALWRRIRDKGS